MVLHLEPEPVFPEHPGEVLGARAGRVVVPLPQIQGHFPRQAGREADDPVPVLLQHLPVDPRPPVVPFEEADRRELDQVLVAGAIPGEQHEVAVGTRGVGGPFAQLAAAEGEVCLEPEDRPHLPRLGLLVESPGAVQVAVVGDRQ